MHQAFLRGLDRRPRVAGVKQRSGTQRPELLALELSARDLLQGGEGTVRPASREVVTRPDERTCGSVHVRLIGTTPRELNGLPCDSCRPAW